MERQDVMRRLCLRWKTDISPSIQNRIEWAKDQQRFWKPFHAGGSHWEVRQLYEAFKVNVDEKTCSSRMWGLSGIPCPHACAVIFKINKRPEDYVPGWFRREKYMQLYDSHIMPVGGMSTWTINTKDKPLPPQPRKMPGRPKKKGST
uniref:uncharacterized protein LOC122604970 n=1 Tax=Erigeron canadensis TaxID=72917 RepID=UPI001CB8A6D1|nr:uncharacterized protein LOC122604970 [Erigeron canadensis]